MSKKQYRVWLSLIFYRELQVAGDIETELTEDELRKELEAVSPEFVEEKLKNYVIYNKKKGDKTNTVIIIKKE